MAEDFQDSAFADNVMWWMDKEGNEYAGMWDESQRASVEGVIISLTDEQYDFRGRDDDGFAEYHGLRFSEDYTLDDFFADIDDDDRYKG